MPELDDLLGQLAEDEPLRRRQARVELLRRLDLPAVAKGVASLLSHAEAPVRVAAAEVLAELGPVAAPAQASLLALLKDPEPSVRRAGCLALAALGEGAEPWELADALMTAAHDPVYAVRKAATLGLYRISPLVQAESANGAGRGTPPRGLSPSVDLPEWISNLALQLQAHLTQRRRSFLLTLPVGSEGRMQRVRLSVDSEQGSLTISTECGPLDPSRHAWALEENLRVGPGRLALRRETKPGRRDELVLLATVPLGEAFPAHTADVVRRLAEQGDEYERLLTGRDER